MYPSDDHACVVLPTLDGMKDCDSDYISGAYIDVCFSTYLFITEVLQSVIDRGFASQRSILPVKVRTWHENCVDLFRIVRYFW